MSAQTLAMRSTPRRTRCRVTFTPVLPAGSASSLLASAGLSGASPLGENQRPTVEVPLQYRSIAAGARRPQGGLAEEGPWAA